MKSSDIKAVARTAAAPSEPLTAGCAESVEKGSSMVVRSIACRHNTVEQAMRQLQQSSLQARAECEGSIHCVGWLCLQVCIPLPDPLPGCCKPPCLQPCSCGKGPVGVLPGAGGWWLSRCMPGCVAGHRFIT